MMILLYVIGANHITIAQCNDMTILPSTHSGVTYGDGVTFKRMYFILVSGVAGICMASKRLLELVRMDRPVVFQFCKLSETSAS